MNRRVRVPVLIPLWIGLCLLASQKRTPAEEPQEPAVQQPRAASAVQPTPIARANNGTPAYRPAYLGVYAAGGHRRGRYVVALSGPPAHYYGHHAWLEQWPFVPGMYFSHPPLSWGQWPIAYRAEAIGPGVYAYRPIYPRDPEALLIPPEVSSHEPEDSPRIHPNEVNQNPQS